jgi:CDP-diacylglycerol pyrophosphatase
MFDPRRCWRLAPMAALALLCGCAAATTSAPPPTTPVAALPPPPVHPHGEVLWGIVHDKCVPDQMVHGDPAPCARVALLNDGRSGFVVLKDKDGVAQHLLMPTDKITGIEDPQVLAPNAPNYFAEAWIARAYVEERLNGRLPRDQIGVAVNSIYGRSQDLLHLHVDCLSLSVRDELRADAPGIDRRWSRRPMAIGSHAYFVRRIDGDDLSTVNPFQLLAHDLPGAAKDMGAWTLAMVGETGPDGQPGFYLLAERADPAKGEDASSEVIQDHECTGQLAYIATHPH